MSKYNRILIFLGIQILLIAGLVIVQGANLTARASGEQCYRRAWVVPGHDYDTGPGGFHHRLVWITMDAFEFNGFTNPSLGSYLRSQSNCDGTDGKSDNYYGHSMDNAGTAASKDLVWLGINPYGAANPNVFAWWPAGLNEPVNPTRLTLGNPATSPNPFDGSHVCTFIPPVFGAQPPVYGCNGNSGESGRYAAAVDDSGRLVIGGAAGDRTIWCANLATNSGGGYADCGPDISTYSSPDGAGYLFRADQCAKVIALAANCNAANWNKWYQAKGLYGSTTLTPLIQQDTQGLGYLKGFYNHFDARNTKTGGFAVGNYYDLAYPLNLGTCSVTTNPTIVQPGAQFTVTVTLNNTGSKPWQNVLNDDHTSHNDGYKFVAAAGNDVIPASFPAGVIVKGGTTYTYTTLPRTAGSFSGTINWNLQQDDQVIDNCGTSVNVQQGFSLVPNATATTDDEDSSGTSENPFTATIHNAEVHDATNQTVIGTISTTRRLYYIKNGAPPTGTNIGLSPYTQDITGAPHTFPDKTELSIQSLGLVAGDQICATLEVTPANGTIDGTGKIISSSGTATSTPSCVKIVDKPFVRVFDSDVMTGGEFDTTCSNGDGDSSAINGFYDSRSSRSPAGSGVQFAALAMGQINAFPSSNFNNSRTGLSFANTASLVTLPDQLGGVFGGNRCINDFFSSAENIQLAENISTNLNINSLENGTKNMTRNPKRTQCDNNTLNITQTTPVSPGKHLFLYVCRNVYISSDIKLSTNWSNNENNIPSFYLVVCGDIYIDPNVHTLDGIYIAQPYFSSSNSICQWNSSPGGGNIYTCADPSTKKPYVQPTGSNSDKFLPGGACNSNSLTVNGTFIAKKIHLDRSIHSLRDDPDGGGTDITSSSGAEIFGLSPEIYLANMCNDALVKAVLCTSSAGIDSIISLPPIL